MLTGNILITGGAGTLGHAIVRQAQREEWDCTFTIFSRSELKQVQMRALFPYARYILGDVTDGDRLSAAIAGHDIVIHAAAMKHVDLADQQPAECYRTNVIGSESVIRACMAQGVKRCIAISTDKAARSVTAYGASKLLMEKLFQAAPTNPTAFTVVRYGNVVASNGSVVRVWREMLARDGYVTATDPNMTRFWLTEVQAVKLIELALEQAAGTATIPCLPALDMRSMARYVLPDAEFRYAGLRTNEKAHEDLVTPEETRIATLYTDPRAPWGYYLLGATPVAKPPLSYRSDVPNHTLTRDELLEMLCIPSS